MPKYGMVIDLTKCLGCNACTVACQAQNRLPEHERWIRVQTFEVGKYPTVTKSFLTVQCMHCDKPVCVSVCPTKASYKRPDGIVMVDENRCIGCKYCVVACPYQARVFREEEGLPEKCIFCLPRVMRGVAPACVVACPTDARRFGDLNDPESEVSRLIATKKAAQLRPDLGTSPNIYFVR